MENTPATIRKTPTLSHALGLTSRRVKWVTSRQSNDSLKKKIILSELAEPDTMMLATIWMIA